MSEIEAKARKTEYVPQRVAQKEADLILGEKAHIVKRGGFFGVFWKKPKEDCNLIKGRDYKTPMGVGQSWMETLIDLERNIVSQWMTARKFSIDISTTPVKDIPDGAWEHWSGERPPPDGAIELFSFIDEQPEGELVKQHKVHRSPEVHTLHHLFLWWREHRSDKEFPEI